MKSVNTREFIWVEKYRPKTVDDCILPSNIKTLAKQWVAKGELQNMMFCGTAGTGKTTLARAVCDEIGADTLLINASDESGIDTLRVKIRQFASTVSLTGAQKVVIFDEADYLNPNSTQPALRAFVEEFSSNCRFILTCNFKHRLIEPLHSRFTPVEFSIPATERQDLCAQIMKRLVFIAKNEGVKINEMGAVAELVKKYYPDFRRTINEFQRISATGSVDSASLTLLSGDKVDELIGYIKDKAFGKCRTWVAANMDTDHTKVFRQLYDKLKDHVEPASLPQSIIILANYQYQAAFVADQQINLMACISELLMSVEWKKK